MATKTKAQIALEKQNEKLSDALELQKENIKLIVEEYGLREDIQKVITGADKQSKSQLEVTKDIIDKTKSVLDNTKKITDETLTTVNLHQLERKAISEGLSDRIEIIQKMKSIQQIQKETNRVVNVQANAFKSIGDSIDGMIKTIPGIGGVLSEVLGTNELGTELSETIRTSFTEAFSGGNLDNVIQGSIEGGVSGIVENAQVGTRLETFFGNGFKGGAQFGLGSAAALAAMVGFVRFGFQGGIESMGVMNRLKRLIAGSTFDAFREAFGNLNNASFTSLFRSKVLGVRFGVEQTDIAKVLRAQTEISGLTQGQALNVQSSIAALASRQGVLAKDVFSDIASNTELFAKFAKDGGQNIGLAAIQAKKLGLSLDVVGTIAEGVLDFQSSIESELKASLLIGRQLNLNRARELALAGDLAGLQQEIVSLVGSEQELNRLNIIQRKSLAQALGITVEQLGKLAGGEVELKSSETRQLIGVNQALTAVASVIAGQLAIRGLGALRGGLSNVVAGSYTGPLSVSNDGIAVGMGEAEARRRAREMGGKAVPFPGRKSGTFQVVGQTMGGRAAGLGLGVLRFAGPMIGFLSFLPIIASAVNFMKGKTSDIADNTKKSVTQELNFPLFTSETLAENKS
jgi:hypothetical protein